MTIIAALVHEGVGYMASDSRATNERGDIVHVEPCKTWRAGGALFGFAGTMRTAQVGARLDVRGRKDHEPFLDWLEGIYLPEFSDRLAAIGLKQLPDLLIVDGASIYYVDDEFSVSPITCPYHAIGSGGRYAIGALYATQGDVRMTPGERLVKAVGAATHNDSRCGGAIRVETFRQPDGRAL